MAEQFSQKAGKSGSQNNLRLILRFRIKNTQFSVIGRMSGDQPAQLVCSRSFACGRKPVAKLSGRGGHCHLSDLPVGSSLPSKRNKRNNRNNRNRSDLSVSVAKNQTGGKSGATDDGSETSAIIHSPKKLLAEREGFEPPMPLRACRISSAVHSTTLPPLLKDAPGRAGGSYRLFGGLTSGKGGGQMAAAVNSHFIE